MALNVTCPHGNSTTECLVSIRSPLGLSVGLPVFFLLLGIVIALMVYTQRSKLRNMLQLGKLKTTEDNLHKQEISQYTGMIRSQSTEQSPIYENFTECTKIVVDMNRSPGEPEELYLQCDSPDDAIYSNDPSCSLAILPDTQEDNDLYIMPDAL